MHSKCTTYYNLAIVLEGQGQLQEAAHNLHRCMMMDNGKDSVRAHRHMASILRKLGNAFDDNLRQLYHDPAWYEERIKNDLNI